MRLNGLCVDEGGRIARRLALVNSVVFRVMRHRSPHVLHPLATHFFLFFLQVHVYHFRLFQVCVLFLMLCLPPVTSG